MQAGGDAEPGRILRLSPECDPTSLELTPAEGFLLSRIDGATPWRLLREIGGLAPERADECIKDGLERGVIVGDSVEPPTSDRQSSGGSERPQAASPSPLPEAGSESSNTGTSAVEIDERRLDEALDLDVAVQRKILEFEASLDRPYHDLLGVARDASVKDIKRAYFRLSREFHPDRYFRREIGDYAVSLECIFKKILEANELLSDPIARAEIEKSMASAEPPAPDPGGAQRPLTPIERLRQRMPFRIPQGVLVQRKEKAVEFFEAAQTAHHRRQFTDAASSMRLAIAFDPFRGEYKQFFSEVQVKAAEQRARELLAKSEASQEESDVREALRSHEDILLYHPHEPDLNYRAARLALQLHALAQAQEFIDRALEHSSDVGAYHVTLARIHQARGEKGHACKCLEVALELDAADHEARELLKKLRRGRGARGRR